MNLFFGSIKEMCFGQNPLHLSIFTVTFSLFIWNRLFSYYTDIWKRFLKMLSFVWNILFSYGNSLGRGDFLRKCRLLFVGNTFSHISNYHFFLCITSDITFSFNFFSFVWNKKLKSWKWKKWCSIVSPLLWHPLLFYFRTEIKLRWKKPLHSLYSHCDIFNWNSIRFIWNMHPDKMNPVTAIFHLETAWFSNEMWYWLMKQDCTF